MTHNLYALYVSYGPTCAWWVFIMFLIAGFLYMARKRCLNMARPTLSAGIILWLFGLLASASLMYDVLPGKLDQVAGALASFLKWILLIHIIVGIAHQYLVFSCIHDFEDTDRSKWEVIFDGWIYSRAEFWVRVIIAALLLVVCGELPLLARELIERHAQHWVPIPIWLFSVSSLLLYIVLLIWDVCAGFRSKGGFELSLLKLKGEFLWSDFLALCFWLSLTVLLVTQKPQIATRAAVFCLLLTMVYCLVIGYRVIREIRGKSSNNMSDPLITEGVI